MSDTSTVKDPPKPTIAAKAKACCSRVGIFAYDVIVVFVLLAVAVIYVKNLANYSLGAENLDISRRAMWFGALGGIVISLKGVYDHCCDNGSWDSCFELWHVGRPISGALTGLITLVLLLAINPKGTPSEPVVYAIAFIFGTQERRFFNFLFEVAALVVRVAANAASCKLSFRLVRAAGLQKIWPSSRPAIFFSDGCPVQARA